jgi:hypothetical protein
LPVNAAPCPAAPSNGSVFVDPASATLPASAAVTTITLSLRFMIASLSGRFAGAMQQQCGDQRRVDPVSAVCEDTRVSRDCPDTSLGAPYFTYAN